MLQKITGRWSVWELSVESKIREESCSGGLRSIGPKPENDWISTSNGVPSEKLSRGSTEEMKPFATGKGNNAGSVVMMDGEYIVSSPKVFSRRTTQGGKLC